jgi:hypothetical protein
MISLCLSLAGLVGSADCAHSRAHARAQVRRYLVVSPPPVACRRSHHCIQCPQHKPFHVRQCTLLTGDSCTVFAAGIRTLACRTRARRRWRQITTAHTVHASPLPARALCSLWRVHCALCTVCGSGGHAVCRARPRLHGRPLHPMGPLPLTPHRTPPFCTGARVRLHGRLLCQ